VTVPGSLAVLVGWTLIGLFGHVRGVVDGLTGRGSPPTLTDLALTLESVWLWALFTPVIVACVRRWPLGRARWRAPLALHTLAALAIAFADVAIDELFARAFVPAERLGVERRFLVELFLNGYSYIAVCALGHALRFARLYHAERVAAARLETELVATRLRALEKQLRPHFFYNTLHTVGALVRTGDDGGALRLLADLGDLLRYVLRQHDAHEVPLRQEVTFSERYLAIEQARFGERMAVHVAIDASLDDALVPHFALQPLVENAVRHGIEKSVRPGSVRVEARREGDALEVRVLDTGAGPRPSGPRPDGIGLATTRARLAQLYGARQSLVVESRPEGGTAVVLRVPFRVARAS
jgi:two-component system LytT family sensor kinase